MQQHDVSNLLHIVDEHFHSVQKVAPSGAPGITLTSGGGAWTLGNFSADIIASGAEAYPFDIHGIDVQNPSANADYEIVLYYDDGGGDIEIGRATFTRVNVLVISRPTVMQTPILPAGSRIRAKIMDSVGGATCTIKIWFHNYN